VPAGRGCPPSLPDTRHALMEHEHSEATFRRILGALILNFKNLSFSYADLKKFKCFGGP
jgi:hypothetical protein